MLALAILTQFFYSWNQHKYETQAKKGTIPPTILVIERKLIETESTLSTNKGEVFGIGIDLRRNMSEENKTESSQQTHSSQEDITNVLYQKKEQGVSGKDTEATKDAELTRPTQEKNFNLTEESLIDILYQSMCMLRLGENISNLSNSSSFHFRDLRFMNDVAEALHYLSNGDGWRGDEYERRLNSVLKSWICSIHGAGWQRLPPNCIGSSNRNIVAVWWGQYVNKSS